MDIFEKEIREEYGQVQSELAAAEQKILDLKAQLVGLSRLAARRGFALEEAPAEAPSLVKGILAVLEQSDQLAIADLRVGLENLGIQTTDGTINTTLYELKKRGLILRVPGIRGVWCLTRPHVLIEEELRRAVATEDRAYSYAALQSKLESEYPDVFATIKGVQRFSFDKAVEFLQEQGHIAVKNHDGSLVVHLVSRKPKF